jgi:hypothetical protein
MNTNTKYCNCSGCNYANQHITSYHKCGACGNFGHGLRECYKNNNGSYDKINALHIPGYTKIGLPEQLHCKNPSCKTKFTHQTNSHHDLFSKDEFGGLSGPDQYGITARKAKIQKDGPECIKNIQNSYTTLWWGMGNMFVFRNVGGKLEQIITEGNYDDFVKGLKFVKCK